MLNRGPAGQGALGGPSLQDSDNHLSGKPLTAQLNGLHS